MSGVADRPTVIVAEDDDALRMLCRINLELDGYSVVEAASGGDLLAAMSGEGADLILLDIRLGDADGVVLARRLRQGGSTVPIAFLTGSVRAYDDELRELGDAFITKPFTLEELSETVARLLRG